MSTIWITYAWADNQSGDVDFVAQELEAAGLQVKLDRWNLKAGTRLWEQIAEFIQSPTQCDAWMLYATQASLGSEPCREEYAYALDRALNTRGSTFPVIGLFPSSVDNALIPPGIRTRLYVSLRDRDWKERVVSTTEGRAPNIERQIILPYHLAIHTMPQGSYSVEVRPRGGSWSPFVAAIPIAEKEAVRSHILHAAAGRPPSGGVLFNSGEGISPDGQWAFVFAGNEATPTMSYYINCSKLPSRLLFGVDGGAQYIVEQLHG